MNARQNIFIVQEVLLCLLLMADVIFHILFDHKVPLFGLMMDCHVSTVDRVVLIGSEKVF
jgi:hypothetical protein